MSLPEKRLKPLYAKYYGRRSRFLGLKLFFESKRVKVTFAEKPPLKKIRFQNFKTLIYNSYLIRQSF